MLLSISSVASEHNTLLVNFKLYHIYDHIHLYVEMLVPSLSVALYAVGTTAALRQFNFTVHSAVNSPGMPYPAS